MRTAGEAASPAWDVKGVGYVVAGHWTPSSHASIRFRCVGCAGADDQGEGSCHFSIHLQQDLLGAGAWCVNSVDELADFSGRLRARSSATRIRRA